MKNKLLILMILVVGISQAEIRQSLGVDQSVDYASLENLGPWDDRNYLLTKDDLDFIPEKDQYLANVPIFYKVLARKANPNLGEFYPRVLYQSFLINYGGLVVNGTWYKEGLGRYYFPDDQSYGKKPEQEKPLRAINDSEVVMDLGGAEMTIEMNPFDPLLGVAGVNGNGVSMYYTSDGGASWTKSQDNPGASCCDPTVDWSSDASRVYQADLASCGGGGCNIRAAYSDDDGQTWQPMITIDNGGGSDKEFIHVDRSATSPYKDNVYITYHTGNTMQFSRSTDMGVTWSTPMAFGTDPTGIGSDITTDAAGNIYYIYPSLSPTTGVRLLKSTDGGVTFAASTMIVPLNGRFDMPLPSMETRNAFIYTSADVDTTTGDIYVAWTDETDDSAGGGTGNTSTNHAWIQVAKSTDAGATWSVCPHPHDATDTLLGTPIDRYHSWLKVGENGVVHVGYYDTRNSTNRTGVDFYYSSSLDGCATWSPEIRASSVTSTNISGGFEWGDYNGLSVVLDKIAMGFTDNRPGQGVAALVASGVNPKGSPSFSLSAVPSTNIAVCSGDTGVSVTIDVIPLLDYNNPVTLSTTTAPTFVSGIAFDVNPLNLNPDTSSNLTFDIGVGGTTGANVFTVQGQGDEIVRGTVITKSLNLNLIYSGGTTSPANLTAPADSATNVSLATTFTWDADANATSYRLMVSTDNTFNTLIVDETVTTNTFNATGLPSAAVLYWKVATQSGCNGSDVESAVFSFSTTALPGDCSIGLIPVASVAYDFESGAQGWTHSGLTGADGWALSATQVNSGVQAFHGAAVSAVTDTVLDSPAIALPTGRAPLTMQFWNRQEMENSTSGCYDGGILEISTDGGTTYTQIPGSALFSDPYDGTVSTSFGNPLAGLEAWCGDPQNWLNSIVDIDSYAGQTVQFRFRKGNDSSIANAGWDIDDVRVIGCATDLIFMNGFEGP